MAERNAIIKGLATTFENTAYAQALWQGGAASFNRTDQWSDIDLVLIVDDGIEQQAMLLAEELLQNEFGIKEKFEIDAPFFCPAWYKHFFSLKIPARFC